MPRPRPSGHWGGTQRLALALQAALLCPDCQGRSGLVVVCFESCDSRLTLYIQCGPFETAGRSCSREMTLFPSQQS